MSSQMSVMPPNALIQGAINEAFGNVVKEAIAPIVNRLEVIERRLRNIEDKANELTSAIDKAKSGNGFVGRLLQ